MGNGNIQKESSIQTSQQFITWTANRIQRQKSFSPFQQRVHPHSELGKFLFSLNYLKRSFFNISFAKSEPLFYLRIYFEDFIKNTIRLTHHLNSFVGFLSSDRIWAYIQEKNIKKFWYFLWRLRRVKRK